MTKKAILSLSSYINLFLLLFAGYSTYITEAAIKSGASIRGLAASFIDFGTDKIMIIMFGLTAYFALTLLVKMIAVKLEKNSFTRFAILLDLVILAVALFITKASIPSLMAGKLLGNLTELGLVCASLLAIIIDLFSLPAERWG